MHFLRSVRWYFLLIVFTIWASCKKTEYKTNEVGGNTAPPDPTIANVIKENYINKLYISVLGREPETNEFASAKNILDSTNLSKSGRELVIDLVFADQQYYPNQYNIARANLLNNLDTAEITQRIAVYNALLQSTTYQYIWPYLQAELPKLVALKNIPSDLLSNTITIKGMQQRVIFNSFYDDLNMGTENFVVSMFQHFLNRYPTTAELSNGKNMVDGFNSTLFFEAGNSKDDFIRIFFSSSDYYEGQVTELYTRYLFRKPSSEEAQAGSSIYKATDNYKSLQKSILASDEFAGL